MPLNAKKLGSTLAKNKTTASELADICNVETQTVHNWLKGTSLSPHCGIPYIASKLGVAEQEISDREYDRSPETQLALALLRGESKIALSHKSTFIIETCESSY